MSRMRAVKNGDTNVNKDKLLKDANYLREAMENREVAIVHIGKLLGSKADVETLKEVEDLLSGLKELSSVSETLS